MKPNPHGQFEWKRRRRLIYAALAYCLVAAACLLWAVIGGSDGAAVNTYIVSVFGLATAVIGSYVFGATWDDKNARQFQGAPSGGITEE